MPDSTDTIFALATAPGKSGVAVIRISGSDVLKAACHFGYLKNPEPRKAIFHSFKREEELVDQGLLLYFPAPHSFTGEDCLEFQIHGSIAVIKKMLMELGGLPGFRQAEAGEFARRAFHQGKLDLTAAEGLADLIEAETEFQRRQATASSAGDASRYFNHLRNEVMQPLALLEAYIDFPEEDIPESVYEEVVGRVSEVNHSIKVALDQLEGAQKIRDGFTVIILGAPNVGKSTLLNALARREVAIVSDQAGTTRDLIEVHLDIYGLPVVVIDTAGIRETEDAIESEGIRRALERAAHADLKLVLFDGTAQPDEGTKALIDSQCLVVMTKGDLANRVRDAELPFDKQKLFWTSARDPQSLSPLVEAIGMHLSHTAPSLETAFVTRQRHREHLLRASQELVKSNEEISLELRCERLRLATNEIGKITGEIQVDELLGIIFSSFCIGK